MDQLKVKDRILENISLSVKKLQSYFAACEDETPAIRNHDRVLQRLCEHLDHALLYGLQDISSGYWVLVLHFTRREAVQQIEELQHIATNLGRSRAWLYLALSESSLESYLRLFQENQGLLQKYYFKNALVCSHDHLTLFLTLVSGLEFIRFDLELDAPYLDVAPYMPEYYKPQNLPDFEERLPSSDSLSLHSFTSLTSTNLEWDDSAIAPSSEDYDFGDIFPVLQSMPSAAWEEGDLTDPVSCPRSSASDPQSVVSLSVAVGGGGGVVRGVPTPRSPTFRHNPFNEDSDTNTSAEVTPVHTASRHDATTGDDTESTSTELEVIRMARRRKPGKKRRGKGAVGSVSSSRNVSPPGQDEGEEDLHDQCADNEEGCVAVEGCGASETAPSSGTGTARRGKEEEDEGEEGDEEVEGLLRLPEMTDTSMDSVGQPLREVMDRLNGTLDGKAWSQAEGEGDSGGSGGSATPETKAGHPPPQLQPFRGDSGGEPPDPSPQALPVATDPNFLQAPPAPTDFYCFTSQSPDSAAPSGGHNDLAGHGQSETVSGGHENEGKGETAERKNTTLTLKENKEKDAEEKEETEVQPQPVENGTLLAEKEENGELEEDEVEEDEQDDRASPADSIHPAEFRVDNNHLLLLMIHVFRENEEQLYKMVRMSTGHMEGDLQPLYLLLTDCYIYLLRKATLVTIPSRCIFEGRLQMDTLIMDLEGSAPHECFVSCVWYFSQEQLRSPIQWRKQCLTTS
ncbi:hypothetical protein JZ751_014851 [Albula glossodonta]|uniref:RUN domain-containing protein n=1 Tax=Albula glossodonta TaxID=121402 RepID=A0A8T2N4Y3_9TELE|nr:hypothetical protein JZ751_014851 [Albula glossodonta]